MAKRKKRRRAPARRTKQIPRKLRLGMEKAIELMDDREYEEAYSILLALIKQFPRSKHPLQMMQEVAYRLNRWGAMALYGEKLYPLERGEEQADTLNNIMVSYMNLHMPALSLQTAQLLLEKHPNYSSRKEVEKLIETTNTFFAKLENEEPHFQALNLPSDEKVPFTANIDRMRFFTEQGKADEAIQVAQKILKIAPDFVQALNNLSLAYFMKGDVQPAIEQAQKVIVQESDNFHALSNLARFHFLTGKFDEAHEYANRLKSLDGSNPDLWNKKAEAFAFLGDHQAIIDAHKQAEKTGYADSPILLHLTASAHYRLGKFNQAWQLWRRATKVSPGFGMAQECLSQRKLPPHERDLPWYWSINYWLMPSVMDGLLKLTKTNRRTFESAVKRVMQETLRQHPYLPALAPHILDRGDRGAREFLLNLTRILEIPELVQTLYDFSLGRVGSDAFRLEVVQLISKDYPHLLPADKKVTLWLNGEPKEIFLMGFEIHGEPDEVDLSDELYDLHERSVELLHEDELEEAEQLLIRLIESAPHFPSAYNHLALAYEKQGYKDKARAQMKTLHDRFPEYTFGRIGLARMVTNDGDYDKAKELLNPILSSSSLHISEFRALAKAEMALALAQDQKEGARSWLEMWKQIEDDHPEIIEWEIQVEGVSNMMGGLRKLLERS